MIRFFRRHDALDDFIEGIRPELTAIPTPAASDALKARIMASRAAGVRHILPAPQSPRRLAPLMVKIAAGTVLLALLIPIALHRSTSVGDADDVASRGLFGEVAFGQTPRRGERPTLAPIRLTAAKVHAVSLEMERRHRDSAGKTAGTGLISIQLSAANAGGTDAWRVVSVNRDALPTPHVDVETVYVSRGDLRLLRRDIHVTPYSRFQRINITQQFARDSVTGRMTTEGPGIGAGRTFARELRPAFGPFMTGTIAPVLLMAAPLNVDWRGSASLLGWAVRDDDVLVPAEFRVEAAETIAVPAGQFDCWRLSVLVQGRSIHYWARKSDGLVVRGLDETDATTRGTREIVLTRIK